MNILELAGLPSQFGITLLLLFLIFTIAPFAAGKDFGLLKIPEFEKRTRRRLRILGPLLLATAIILHLPFLGQPVDGATSDDSDRADEAAAQALDTDADTDVEREYTQAEIAVDNIHSEIGVLRGTYETREDYGPASDMVADKGPKLADQMLAISEEQLDLGHRISQHQYAAYALAMSASAERAPSRKILLAQRAQVTVEKAIELVREAESRSATGTEYSQKLMFWINDDQVRERNLYILAVALAVMSREKGGVLNSEVIDALDQIKHISPRYLERFRPDKNSNLNWVLLSADKKGEQNGH